MTMTTLSHLTLIDDLQAKIHECLAEFITGAPIAIVDFPNIRNVGDAAIWIGQIAYLTKRHGCTPIYVSEIRDFSPHALDARMPTGPIFIHGGGNFGDLWVGHQNFREQILQRWPGRPVIQFPASIHYESKARVDETARIIGNHGNFTLLVRDEQSRDFAEKHFDCRVLLCPDMALCVGPLNGPRPTTPVLAMLRGDREKASTYDLSAFPDVPVEDWVSEPWLPVRAAKLTGAARALGSFDLMSVRIGKFNAAARQRFDRGFRQIGRARAIVTDRLHVHVVSLLMGRPHAVLDNSYGKISGFMSAFSGNTNLTYRAKSLADGIEWARAQN
jgi:exopolysaccharide biosynthesis predicted pyruvyltransferase EpsI